MEERRGSLGQLAVSATSHGAAPSCAHLHAIKSRKGELTEDCQEMRKKKRKELLRRQLQQLIFSLIDFVVL